MKTLFFIIMALVSFTGAFSQCQRNTPFTADFLFQTNGQRVSGSLNFGFLNTTKLSLQGGAKMYDTQDPEKANVQKVNLIPTGTILVKHRFNGENSKLVHALGITAGWSNYREISYRIYGAPDGYSFATVGGMVSYSNVQGLMVGFVIMGIF